MLRMKINNKLLKDWTEEELLTLIQNESQVTSDECRCFKGNQEIRICRRCLDWLGLEIMLVLVFQRFLMCGNQKAG